MDNEDASLSGSEYTEEEASDDDYVDNKISVIVSWPQLKKLFERCWKCGSFSHIKNVSVVGSLISVQWECDMGHSGIWRSQEMAKKRYEGNVMLAAYILFSGLTFGRVKEIMDIADVLFIKKSFFFQVQNSILFPSINTIYTKHASLIKDALLKDDNVELIGDGRFDSPGYNATYGTYTLMNEKNNNVIIDFHITHVSEVKNSQNMERMDYVNFCRHYLVMVLTSRPSPLINIYRYVRS